MQPMLMIRSMIPGVVYINGRFAGEAGEESAVSIPVSSRGTLYVELRPILGGYLPLARRIALSQGKVVPSSIEGQDGMYLVQWPGAVLDLELMPERARPASFRTYERDFEGIAVRLIRNGAEARVELGSGHGSAVHALPDGALPPDCRYMPDGALYLGGALEDGGRYALVVQGGLMDVLLSLAAQDFEVLENGDVRALIDMNDTVGHAQLLTYRRGADGYEVADVESMWSAGAPTWPATAEDTAIAALEAARLGLMDEAGGYFTQGFALTGSPALQAARESLGCVRLKYPTPGGEQAVGLVRLIGGQAAEVSPVSYRAVAMGGVQGMWRLEALSPLP